MTDKNPDTTAALLAALADWLAEAVTRATPEGRIAAATAMGRLDADIMMTIQFKRGHACLYAAVAGVPPVEIAEAILPPLTFAGIAATDAGDSVH